MARTLEEGKNMLARKKAPKKPSATTAPPKRIARRSIAARPAPAYVPVPPHPLLAVPPTTATRALYRVPTIDRPTKPTKATIFKTKSKENLPLPAFGFIDICFCVDSTGSMGS